MTKTIFILLISIAVTPVFHGEPTFAQSKSRVRSRSSAANGPLASQSEPKFKTVRARAGDSLTTIAARANVAAEEISQLNGLSLKTKLRRGQRIILPAATPAVAATRGGDGAQIIGQRIKFADGGAFDADEAWREGGVVWYKRGRVTQSLDRDVLAIEPIFATKRDPEATKPVPAETKANVATSATWIYLVGGARFKVDEVNETAAGAWYNRGNLSIFLERERIDRIEKEQPGSRSAGPRNLDWTSGSAGLDELIKANGARFGIDPYLIFCVVEHESHFRQRALSPKGAQGLMQLMPATARRFGVRRPFNPADNIKGGTQYLRELMGMFGGQVNLVLASYNAGEGAVMKYGRNVPPYRETREYVKRISKRYGLGAREPGQDNEIPVPQK